MKKAIVSMPKLEEDYKNIINLFNVDNVKKNDEKIEIPAFSEEEFDKTKFHNNIPEEIPDISKLIDKNKEVIYVPKNKNYFSNIGDLKSKISTILINNNYKENLASFLAKDIIWSEDFFTLFLIKYSNMNLINKEYLNNYVHDTFAEKLYKRSIILDNKRENTWYSDGVSSNKILNNEKIVNTIICIGERIYKFFNICNKVSFVLSNIVKSGLQNKDYISKESIWFIYKSLIRDLSLKHFNDKNYLFVMFFSIIESNLNIQLNSSSINNLINDKLLMESLKKAIEWYNEDFKILIEQ